MDKVDRICYIFYCKHLNFHSAIYQLEARKPSQWVRLLSNYGLISVQFFTWEWFDWNDPPLVSPVEKWSHTYRILLSNSNACIFLQLPFFLILFHYYVHLITIHVPPIQVRIACKYAIIGSMFPYQMDMCAETSCTVIQLTIC